MSDPNKDLYPFQTEDVRTIHRKFDGRCLIGNEVGLGKTRTALNYAWRFLPDDPPGPIVVICPAHLKLHWQREARKHLGLRTEILSGRRVPEDKLLPLDPNQIFVVNYDVLCPPNWKVRTEVPQDSWLAFLMRLNPRLVIADEFHYCAAPSSMRTRAVRTLARRVPRFLGLTGTPINNRIPGLWPLLNILRPRLFPSLHDFCVTYTHAVRRWYAWEFKGARNLDQLNQLLLDTVMIRRRKEDVLDQLPSIQHTVIPVEVELKEYRKAENDFLGWLTERSPLLAQSAAKAMELTKLNYLKELAGKLKHKSVVQWVEDFLEETGQKLLIGAIHYSVTEPLVHALGRRALLVDGRDSHHKKNQAFDSFNGDSSLEVLVGNMQAVGTGWSCTSTSHGLVVEIPWIPSEINQFCGRLHGIGRGVAGDTVHVRYLVAASTIEEDLCELIQTKQGWHEGAIDGITEGGDLKIHDQIVAKIRQRQRGVNDVYTGTVGEGTA